MKPAIGTVTLALSQRAQAYVLDAVRSGDRRVEELLDGLCGNYKPAKVAGTLEQLELTLSSRKHAIPHLRDLRDVAAAESDIAECTGKIAELVTACREAAFKVIRWLADNGEVILDGDVVRAAPAE